MKGRLDALTLRLAAIEQGSLLSGKERPDGLPASTLADWPATAFLTLQGIVQQALTRGVHRPLAWMSTADLLAAGDRLGLKLNPHGERITP